jgi:hypothetical protein
MKKLKKCSPRDSVLGSTPPSRTTLPTRPLKFSRLTKIGIREEDRVETTVMVERKGLEENPERSLSKRKRMARVKLMLMERPKPNPHRVEEKQEVKAEAKDEEKVVEKVVEKEEARIVVKVVARDVEKVAERAAVKVEVKAEVREEVKAEAKEIHELPDLRGLRRSDKNI